MNIVLKKTGELSAQDKISICNLFNKVFRKEMSLEYFERKFAGTCTGYSYHNLVLHDDRIVGCWSFIPYRYSYFCEPRTFALSVDTMIDENYRGHLGNLVTMADKTYHALRDDNIAFVFGFPNEMFYPVVHRVLKWEDIGKLDFYALPINIGRIKKGLGALDFISKLYSKTVNMVSKINKAVPDVDDDQRYHIRKMINKTFLKQRYDHRHKVINLSERCYFVYSVITENDFTRTAYLVDVSPLEKKHVERAVSYIFDRENKNIDIIIYVGELPFLPVNLLRIPERYQPRRVTFAGKIIMDSLVGKEVYHLENWNVNLSNFDVR